MAASTHDEEEQYSQSSGGSDSDFGSDEDPNYNILEETQSRLSSLSMKKKSISRIGKGTDAGEKKVDEKSFEKVQEIIAAGEIGKLKVEQCKVYLRKNGLRLSGNKETLIQRVKEHQEILNGEGEDKYPVSSFVISCKGDACTGDVVMFEQNVYEMFNIASRSASGPPSGTRVVAGRIVKESYGAAKQQHTFTIEVLWSKGEKALPPLHPLLIKGRNLYRLTTLRQKWEYEGERQKILMEKHLRGSLARSNREIRIQEKEKRKMLRETRAVKRQESDRSQTNPTLIGNMGMHAQQGSCSDLRKMAIGTQKISILSHKAEANPRGKIGPKATCSQHSGSSAAAVNVVSGPLKAAQHSGLSTVGVKTERSQQAAFPLQESERTMVASKFFNGHDKQQQIRTRNADSIKPTNYIPLESSLSAVSRRQVLSRNSFQQHTSDTFGAMSSNSYRDDPFSHFNKYSGTRLHGGTWEENHHREPLTSINQQRSPTHWQSSRSVNHPAPMRLQHRHHNQLCKYYPQGRCYYGDNCKFSHDWER